MVDVMEIVLIVILIYRMVIVERELGKTNKYIKKVESSINTFKSRVNMFKSTLASSVEIDKNYNDGK